MKPTDILSAEHRVIEQVLQCLDAIARQGVAGGALDKASAEDAIAFLRNFADRCHHGKEETHLFPAMEAKGYSPECGPTAVMRLEHEQGRAHIRAMAEAVEAASAGDQAALARFAQHARGYIGLLEGHIQKEDHCLFSMANQAFSEADQRELLARFERVEAEEMGEGTHEKYLAIANALAERYGVSRAAAAAHSCHSCGH